MNDTERAKNPPDPDNFCRHCHGKKFFREDATNATTGQFMMMNIPCPFCGGTGRDELATKSVLVSQPRKGS